MMPWRGTKAPGPREVIKKTTKNIIFLKVFLSSRGKKVGFHLRAWRPEILKSEAVLIQA
jgi:hypothetical protein